MITLSRTRRPVKPSDPPRNPRDSWPAWTDEDRWSIVEDEPAPAVEPEPRPTPGPDFEPTREEEAYWAGYTLGFEGECAKAPADYTDRERYHFTCGRIAGFEQSEEGQDWIADMQALRDQAFTLPGEGWHEAEVIEARGILASRMEGGAL